MDISYKTHSTEIIISPESKKGAAWIAKNLTTNVTDIHYTDKKRGMEVIQNMREDGLQVKEM